MEPLDERFGSGSFDPRLRWLNEPPTWRTGADDGLTLATVAGTDFWQGTHYGFRVDNGHALLADAEGDFALETEVAAAPLHQYDQAGLMVRLSPSAWLKTSVEFEPGEASRLGAVVTNGGWSDWSTQDIDPAAGRHVAFRVVRRGADLTVEAAVPPAGRWSQIRLARLHDAEGATLAAGLYACSPKASGLTARFRRLRLASLR